MSNLLNINSEQLVKYTNKLERIGKNDLPIAVRGALNKTALHAKQNTLPKVFSREFINRRSSFLRSHSSAKLESFSNLNISTMESGVGIIAGKSIAGDNLEKQEEGGSFDGRGIPMDATRKDSINSNRISGQYYYRKFQGQKGVLARNKRRSIISTEDRIYEIRSSGNGKGKAGTRKIPKMSAIKTKGFAKRGIGNKPIWSTLYMKKQSVNIKPTHFVNKSANEAAKVLPDMFVKEAKKRIEKRLK